MKSKTCITQKNNWAFGDAWDPHYTGRNADWGASAQDWLSKVWFPNCNVRGPLYDFKTSMWLSGWAWDVDGDDVMVLTESASGFPMLAYYPAPKVGTTLGWVAVIHIPTISACAASMAW